ncbi:MAG TPA: protein kinase [Gemmataceae bacterium]|nr:protein kinase [Gemmataceae bacterium]
MFDEQLTLDKLVEVLLEEQRLSWQGGDRALAETYFKREPVLLRETPRALKILYNEIVSREAAGEHPQLEEYVLRFSHLNDQLTRLFEVHQAIESDQLLTDVSLDAPASQPASARARHPSQSSPTVAGHEVLEELGRGGMGVVYKARQVGLNRVVALKMILAGQHASQAQLARFRAEAEAVARLQHPNIVQIYDVGDQDGRPYFSLEFVDGGSLAQALSGDPQPPRLAASLIQTLALAMHAAHQRGIVHRDLKPANILLQRQSQDGSMVTLETQACAIFVLRSAFVIPKITDFGLAKLLDVDVGQTDSGMILGTPSYMAPEQADARSGEIGPAADVYALGAILYEMLTGRPPFKAETQLDTLRQVLSDEPVPLSRFHLKVSRDLSTICMKCLQKGPDKRYRSALSLAEDLERFLADRPIHARRTSKSEQVWRWCRRNPAVAGLVLAVSSLVVTAAVGATLAALRLRIEQNATLAQLHKTEEAEDAGQRRLFGSLLGQARASRLSQRIGRRFKTLDVLAEATELARALNLGEDEFLKLRSEAASCMALADLRVDHEWPGWLPGSFHVAFDGALERYARVDRNGAVSIRRVSDDVQLCQLPSMGPAETRAEFSSDGRIIAVGSDHHMKAWNLTGAEPTSLLEIHDCNAFNFSPDDKQMAIGHQDGTITFHELPSGRRTQVLRAARPIYHLAFNPRLRQLAVTYGSGAAVLDLDTGRAVVDIAKGTWVNATPAWHPEGKLLAVDEGVNRITLWDVPAGKPRFFLEGYKNSITGITFNHAGSLLASTGWEGKLRLWDPGTGKQLFSTDRPTEQVRFSPDDQRLAAGHIGGQLCIWKMAAGQEYRTLGRHPDILDRKTTSTIATSPKHHLLAAGVGEGVQLSDLATGKSLAFLKLSRQSFVNVAFEPSGALLINGPRDGVWRWPVHEDVTSPGLLKIGPPQKLSLPGSSGAIAVSGDGRVVANAQFNGGACVLHAEHPDRLVWLRPHAGVVNVAVSADGSRVATGSFRATGVKIWDSGSGKLLKELLPADSHVVVGFSPNRKWLATSGGDPCRLWAVDTWQEGLHIGGQAFSFSPDSALLAVGTGDGAIRLVDPESGREHVRMEDPNQEHGWVGFSSDGTQLVTNTDEPSIHVWDLPAIRRQLAEMRLDWDLPSYPPAPEERNGLSLRVSVDLGPFGVDSVREALSAYSVMLALLPCSPEAYYQRALAHSLLKHWPEALDDSNRSLMLRSDHIQSYYLRSQLLEQLGQHRQAMTDLNEAIRREPNRVPPASEMQAALGLDPLTAEAYNENAWRYLSGPPDQCVPGLAALLTEKAVLLEPGNWYCRNSLGVAYYRLGHWREALATLTTSLNLPGERFDGFDLVFLAMAHQQLGQVDRARKCYEQVIQWQSQARLRPEAEHQLNNFRAEAAARLGLPPPR